MDHAYQLDQTPQEFGTGHPLSQAEIHTVQAIGDHPQINLTELSQKMGVTKGATSQMVTKLVKRALVAKKKSVHNNREIVLELTKLGWIGHREHEAYHRYIVTILRDYYGEKLEKELSRNISVLNDFKEILKRYEATMH